VPLCLVGILVVVFSLRQLSDADLGFHLKGGKWIIENKAFPSNDTYTYTVSQNEYIDLHWFFQVLLYGIYSMTGYSGLSIYNMLLAVILFGLLFYRNRIYKVHPAVDILLLFTGLICIQSRIIMRPEMFTYIFLTLYFIILDNYTILNKNKLWMLPVVMLLWVNSQGLFILGWFVAGIYIIENYYRNKKFDKQLVTWTSATVVASFFNPYFFKGVAFPFYLFTRFNKDNVFNNIVEFKSVFESPDNMTQDFILFYILTGFFAVAVLFTLKRRRLVEYFAGLAFIYLGFTAIRNIPLFVITMLPFTGLALTQAIESIPKRKFRFINNKNLYYSTIVISVIVLIIVIRLFSNAWYTDRRMTFKTGLGLDKYQQPVEATDFIKENLPEGKILNDLNTGGWLTWALDRPTFIDGRLEVMREEFYMEFLKLHREGGLKDAVTKYQPEIIIFDYEANIHWIIQLTEMPEWKIMYLDEIVAVFAKESALDNQEAYDFNNLLKRRNIEMISDNGKVWNILRSEKVSSIDHWFSGFYKKTQYLNPEYLKTGTFADLYGHLEVAERLYLEFVKKDGKRYYQIFRNLGLLYLKTEQYNKALYCWKLMLDHEPVNQMAIKNYHFARSKLKK